MQRFTTKKNQEEHGPDVKLVWRNLQKTIAVEKMSQTKPHASVPPPPAKSNGKYFWRVFLLLVKMFIDIFFLHTKIK
jgi:hypothetical protein